MASVSKASCAAGHGQAANKGTPRKTSSTQALYFHSLFFINANKIQQQTLYFFWHRCCIHFFDKNYSVVVGFEVAVVRNLES